MFVFAKLPLVVGVYAAHLGAVLEGVAPEGVGRLTALTAGPGVGHDGDLEAGCYAANDPGEEAEGCREMHRVSDCSLRLSEYGTEW